MMLTLRICSIIESILVIIALSMKWDASIAIICFCVVYICKNILEIMRDEDE